MSEKTYYRGKLAGFVYSESKEKKTPTFEFRFDIDEKKVDGEWVEVPSITRSVYCYATETRVEQFAKELQLIGFNVHETDLGDIGDWVEQNQGRTVNLSMKHEEYQGKTKERWELAQEYTPKVSDVAGLKGIAKRFGSLVKSVTPKPGNTTKPVQVKVNDKQAQDLEAAMFGGSTGNNDNTEIY